MLSNLDAEKFVLGAILTDPDAFPYGLWRVVCG